MQFTDFSKIPVQQSPLASIWENMLKGYKMQREPARMGRQQEHEELANAMSKLLLQEEPERFRSALEGQSLQNEQARMNLKNMPEAQRLMNAYRQAQIEQLNREAELPFGGKIAPGSVGQAQWLDMIRNKFGDESQIFKDAQAGYQADLAATNATIGRNKALSNSVAWRSLPSAERERLVANAVGMGYDPAEAAQMFSEGSSLQDLADSKGADLQDVKPSYPLLAANISQQKNRTAFMEEIGSLEKNMSNATKEYGRKFFGYSPKQVLDAVRNKNPDTQGKFLAARALQPELAALRLKAAGGNVGIEAIHEMQNAVLGKSKVFESAVSPEAREAMNKYLTQWLDQAVSTYVNSVDKSALVKSFKAAQKQEMTFNPSTGGFE